MALSLLYYVPLKNSNEGYRRTIGNALVCRLAMVTYAIGDLQGCFDELRALLEKIGFNPAADRLWFTGDLVNRGSQSLEVLRFVKDLGDRAIIVLGNQDVYLLAVAAGVRKPRANDTF